MLPSSACVSGTEDGAAIELHRQDNAALESVYEHVKERRRTRGEPHYLFLYRLVFQQVRACITGCSHHSQTFVR